MLTCQQYLDAVSGVAELSLRNSLSKKDEIRLSGLMAIAAQGKHLFKPEEIAHAQRDALLRASGLPREASRGSRRGFLDESIEREWRDYASGKDVRLTTVPNDGDREARANLAGTESISYTQTAGRFVPFGFYDRVFESMRLADQLYEPWASNQIESDDGNPFSYPIVDDVAASAAQVTEATQSSQSAITNFAQTQLQAWSFRTNLVVLSLELLQDSGLPWPAILERIFAGQLARGIGAKLVNGSGVNGPTGLVTAAVSTGNIVVANGSSVNDGSSNTGANSIGSDDLVNVMKKLDPAYWMRAVWAMHPSTLLSLWSQRDKQGRPLVGGDGFLSGRKGLDQAITVMGKPVALCPSMDTIGNAKNPAILFDPTYFIFRVVPSSAYVRRFQELPGLVENGLVGFQAWLRCDSSLVAPNASFPPAVVLQSHS